MMPSQSVTQRSGKRAVCPVAALWLSLTLGLGLSILSLALPGVASASRPGDVPGGVNGWETDKRIQSVVGASRPGDVPGQEEGPVIGLASDALGCLAVGDDLPGEASGVVHLTWPGQAERARLVLSVSGTEAAHPIKVNGQPVASVPVHPRGQPCRDGESFYLDIPPGVLVQGDNLIEITNDAALDDCWTASQVRLEVIGHFADLQTDGPAGGAPAGVASIAATSRTVWFINPYDGSSQEARVVVSDDYNGGTPAPLVIYVHGRGSDMYEGENALGAAIDDRGWLLASPQLHGSWTGDPQPDPPGKYAYASLESQYDIIGTLNYMLDNYAVITSQVYLAGSSMGGQIDTVTAAKFPHVFAAVFDNKGPTNMGVWYNEQWEKSWMERECHVDGDPKTPTENPFCYQRRSGLNFASNYVHVPISITHSVSDALVPIHHSRDLRDAINSFNPDRVTSVYEDAVVGPTCPPYYHCYSPDPVAVLDFLEQFVLNNNPSYVHITTDESKSYHWLNVVQTGGDHWSEVEVATYPLTATVAAVISDTEPLTVAFNLGSAALSSSRINDRLRQPGMGLPATTYLVRGGGNYELGVYASGYFSVPLTSTGQFGLSVSAVEAELWADPAMVLGGRVTTSTITAVVRDQLDNPAPGGTVVELSTTEGVFPGGGTTWTGTVGTGGLVTTTLTLTPAVGPVEITASVESITGSTSVAVVHPAIDVLITPDQVTTHYGQDVTCSYRITNTGDITLTGVTLVDDYGPLCENTILAAEAAQTFSRTLTLYQTTTITATVTGTDPLGYDWTRSRSATVIVDLYGLYLPLVTRNG